MKSRFELRSAADGTRSEDIRELLSAAAHLGVTDLASGEAVASATIAPPPLPAKAKRDPNFEHGPILARIIETRGG